MPGCVGVLLFFFGAVTCLGQEPTNTTVTVCSQERQRSLENQRVLAARIRRLQAENRQDEMLDLVREWSSLRRQAQACRAANRGG